MRLAIACVAVLAVLAPAPASAQEPTLPVVTQKLPEGAKGCASAVGTPLAGVPWAQEFLGLDTLARRSTGAGVRIGLVDTGFDAPADPALAARVRTLPSVYATSAPTPATSATPRKQITVSVPPPKKTAAKSTTSKSGTAARFAGGHDAVAPAATDGPTAPTGPDCVGHGTAVASLIASATGTDPGVHGLAPDASIISVQATDDAGNTDADHLALAITAVVRAGAQIVAVPTGTSATSRDLDQSLAAAAKAGVLVVASSRFDAQNDDGAIYPAASRTVLSVSDVGPGGLPPQDTPTGSPVALAAPGDRVVAVGHGGRGQVTGSGPSYAVGYVAAAAALVKSYRPELTGTEIAQRLLRTASPPPGDGPDPQPGLGVLDVQAALDTEFDSGGHAAEPVAPRVRAAPARHTGLPVALGVAGGAGAVLLLAAGTSFSVLARRRRLSSH